ncbi:translocation/assembly module TamB [Polaribacter haliotis]|uniref:Translocation/assembly module TamB n=1 Tax=Polaribacter haliotis TaxID=1888915 RepID=A0A7L8AJZ5_9FLAO|nr:translocation/assembly module TamB domain-containing protein [Polaribacter haliotis]QOD62316.1 translocation/assembly module TamB [Polaribacter haliotis]
MPKKRKYRFLRRTLRVLLGILLFLFLIVIFIRSSWGQSIIVDKAVSYVSNKTDTKVAVEKLFVTFDGSVQLDGLYLEDTKGDTLVYSKSLEANVPLWAIIRGNGIGVDNLTLEGLRANITRKDTVSGYNFQFLIDAFEPENPTPVVKDSTAKPLDIVIGDLFFKDIDFLLKDDVLGLDGHFKIGELEAKMETTDLENMSFEASNINLSNSNIRFVQNPPQVVSTEEVPLPKFSVDNFTIENVIAFYESKVDNISSDINIDNFYAEIPQIDLAKNNIYLDKLQLSNSKISLNTVSKKSAITSKSNETVKIEWPEFIINIADINLENNAIIYSEDNAKPQKNVFNPKVISLENITFNATDIFLKDKKAGAEISKLNFNEASGLNLHQLSFNLTATDNKVDLNDLDFKLNNNVLVGNADLKYASLNKLLATPEKTKVNLNIPTFKVSLDEVFKFQPSLRKNVYLKKASKKLLTGNIQANGSLASINLRNAKVNWGNSTKISANGTFMNVTDPNKLLVDISSLKAETKRSDILQFIDEKELGIQLPENVLLVGKASGSLDNISANAKITTTQGIAEINGNFKNKNTISYDAVVKIEDYKVNELLKNPQFGSLSLTVNSKGSGKSINTLDATLEANVSKFTLNNYAIKDLIINGDVKNGEGNITSKYKDENLNIALNGKVFLDSIASKANIKLNVIGADLQALGFMNRNVKTGMDISLDFKGNSKNYDIESKIINGVFVYDDRTYLLGAIDAKAYVDKDTTSLSVKNKMLNLDLESNTDPQTFTKAIQRHVFSYFYRDEKIADSIKNPVNLKFEGKIAQSSLLKDVFLVNVKDVDTIDIAVDFNEKARKLDAQITAPHINYSGNELDSLAFSMTTDKDNFNFDLGFKRIVAGPLDVPRTYITGNQTNNELSLNFSGSHNGEKLMNVNTKITGNRDDLKFTVNPDSLVLNKGKWNIPTDNEISLINNKIAFKNFKISKDNQSIEITDKLPNVSKNHIAIDYKNFKINEVFNYLNPETEITTGILNGSFILEDPFEDTGIIADLNVSKLEVLKTNLGTLKLDAKSLGNSKYDFNADLKGGDVNLDLKGDYFVSNTEANLNLDLNINEFKMKALNTFSLGEVKETNGSFSGEFKVTGTTSEPKYNGDITFKNAGFNISKLNTKFLLNNETLKVDNSGLTLSNFKILDAKKNALILSGKIGTESFVNPTFDLNVDAKNFRVLNATKEDNEFLYGTATFNANAKLTGDLQIPKLDAKLTLGAGTDVTYVMPSVYANVEERDGIVAFVNRKNPDAILTRTEEQTATITGFDISASLKVDRKAAVTVVINKDTGDNFKASGDGNFIFTMVPNGRINLTGGYEIWDGHYELNLYNLVDRKFLIAPGSRVSWSGDPFDADLDVRAIYKLETSASPLMAPQISGAEPSVKSKYKQVLPFEVSLNIDGELLQPKISFGLDMPEEDRGSIGGQVYGRVQQVNQQEAELNKQVFSLLVLNRFYPDAGSDGSSGGFATVARDNLNDAVSGQLNAFSNKILGGSGIELDFGLNSFTDYQGDAPTDRTQLDIAAQKKLFNDRLTVRVGSEVDIQGSSTTGEKAPLIGNVSLEYKITENGRYRLKGFRESKFENVIDGQTIVSGIALIFTQEFNQFSELWNAILRSSKKKEEEAKAKKKETDDKIKEKESVLKK